MYFVGIHAHAALGSQRVLFHNAARLSAEVVRTRKGEAQRGRYQRNRVDNGGEMLFQHFIDVCDNVRIRRETTTIHRGRMLSLTAPSGVR